VGSPPPLPPPGGMGPGLPVHWSRNVQPSPHIACMVPPAILEQSPAGTSTKDFGSRAIVA
jgi:hypothetical protein